MTPLALMARCAGAFSGPLDAAATVDALATVSAAVHEDDSPTVAKRLLRALVAFTQFLGTEAARDPDAMRTQVRNLTAVRVHFLATHTFLLDHMIRLESHLMLPADCLVVYVHDVSCGIHIPSTDIVSKLVAILDAFERVETLSVIDSECCFVNSLLVDCPDDICHEHVARVLCNMYGRCEWSFEFRENMSTILFLMTHPMVVSSFHFHLATRRQLCVYLRSALKLSQNDGRADKTQALRSLLKVHPLGDVSAVLVKYMAIGPYETNVLFLELGEVLEEIPYLPLVEAFLTSFPKYPFPPATWRSIEKVKDEPAAKRCLEHRLLEAKDEADNIVRIQDLKPGEWFCRVVPL